MAVISHPVGSSGSCKTTGKLSITWVFSCADTALHEMLTAANTVSKAIPLVAFFITLFLSLHTLFELCLIRLNVYTDRRTSLLFACRCPPVSYSFPKYLNLFRRSAAFILSFSLYHFKISAFFSRRASHAAHAGQSQYFSPASLRSFA